MPPTKKNNLERHPWRLCPLGQHWVREHKRHTISGTISVVIGHCRLNRSRFDQLYADEGTEIAGRYFETNPTDICNKMFEYDKRENVDKYIAGWTKYWNEVLQPSKKLSPNLVKALIASESSFINLKGQRVGHGGFFISEDWLNLN